MGAGVFGTMAAVTSAGSSAAALWMAGATPPTDRRIMTLAALLGVTLLATAASPTLAIVLVVLPVMGYAQLGTGVSTNAANQLRTPPSMRGRTIALYFSVNAGAAALGSFLMGALSDAYGARSRSSSGAWSAWPWRAPGACAAAEASRSSPSWPLADGSGGEGSGLRRRGARSTDH